MKKVETLNNIKLVLENERKIKLERIDFLNKRIEEIKKQISLLLNK